MKKCDQCSEPIRDGEERELHSRTLCEDCYMDALSPSQTCDPWAVYLAKSSMDHSKEKPALTERQSEILAILKETGGIEREALAQRLGIKPSDLEKEVATLRHMEMLKGALVDGKVHLKLW